MIALPAVAGLTVEIPTPRGNQALGCGLNPMRCQDISKSGLIIQDAASSFHEGSETMHRFSPPRPMVGPEPKEREREIAFRGFRWSNLPSSEVPVSNYDWLAL